MSRCSGDYARSVKGDDSCPALEKLADSGVRTRGQCNAAEESASTSCSGVVELADRAGPAASMAEIASGAQISGTANCIAILAELGISI